MCEGRYRNGRSFFLQIAKLSVCLKDSPSRRSAESLKNLLISMLIGSRISDVTAMKRYLLTRPTYLQRVSMAAGSETQPAVFALLSKFDAETMQATVAAVMSQERHVPFGYKGIVTPPGQ